VSVLDRFRPKWQHSDIEVRAAAVRQLGKDDAELLGAVAQSDPDAKVRRIAVKKLDDPKLLLEIGREDPDEGLRAYAMERAGSILVEIAVSDEDQGQSERAVSHLSDAKDLSAVAQKASLADIRRAALDRITDEKVLGDVVRDAENLEIRREALERITDTSVLRTVAGCDTSELAVAAVEKIADPETLHDIAEDRSAHKNARRLAGSKRDTLIDDDHPIRLEQRKATLLEMCRRVEALAEDRSLDEAIEAVRQAESQWEEESRNVSFDPDLAERFRRACDAVSDRRAKIEQRKAERERQEKALEDNLASRAALCERLENLDGKNLARELEDTKEEWDRLVPVDDERAKSLAQRFTAAREAGSRRYREWEQSKELQKILEEAAVEAEKLLETPNAVDASREFGELKKKWDELKPTSPSSSIEDAIRALDARIEDVGYKLDEKRKQEHERKKEAQQENLSHISEFCSRLESLSETEEISLKDAFKALRESQSFLKEMGPLPPSENRKKWRAKLADARKRLHTRVQDYRETDEWRRWANVDLQDKIIHQMEALLETKDLRDAANRLRELQAEWKEVSAVPRDQAEALWQRFKKARDEVRQRCDSFFSELDKERSENLKKKLDLCEKVEALTDSTSWEKTAQEIKNLQQEWKNIGAVPQRESNAVWKRFRKSCDQFFDRRKEHYSGLKKERDENLKAKIDLCEKAESLAESTDWKSTADELKRLQMAWKKIGPVPRKKSEAIWKRFRKACDQFFDRYKRRDEVELEDNLKAKEGICQELESLHQAEETASTETVAEKLQDAWTRWKKIGFVPKKQEETIEARFRQVCDELLPTASEKLRGTDLDPDTNRKKKQRLCERLEEIVDHAADELEPASSSIENLAERLKSALAARTIGGDTSARSEFNWKQAAQQVRRLKSSWERLAPVPGKEGEAIAARFQKAYSKFFELRPDPSGSRSHEKSTSESSSHSTNSL
jgi:hypothetical protein